MCLYVCASLCVWVCACVGGAGGEEGGGGGGGGEEVLEEAGVGGGGGGGARDRGGGGGVYLTYICERVTVSTLCVCGLRWQSQREVPSLSPKAAKVRMSVGMRACRRFSIKSAAELNDKHMKRVLGHS